MNNMHDKQSSSARTRCPGCGSRVDGTDRFCRECGAPLKGAEKANGGMRGLVGLRAFGLAVIALAIFYAFLHYGRRASPGTEVPSQRIPITDVGRPGDAMSTSTPLTLSQSADELYNQAMTAFETGDSAGTRQFVPMAIAAYQAVDSLDPDRRYHLALLNLVAGRPEDALAHADTILAEIPNHLLGLAVAARAYDRLGRTELAAEFFQRFLDEYTPETAASRSEYIDHGRTLTARRELAIEYLKQHSPTGGIP
jgi:tetratricopeptide (TPR) repeat protein